MPIDAPPRKPHVWPTTATAFVVPGALLVVAGVFLRGLPVVVWSLFVATWLGATVHVALSFRGRQRATVARTFLDVVALAVAVVLVAPGLAALADLLR